MTDSFSTLMEEHDRDDVNSLLEDRGDYGTSEIEALIAFARLIPQQIPEGL
jgi:hypothetical protein